MPVTTHTSTGATNRSADQVRGVMDVDSHEMFPLPLWEATFGEAGARMAEFYRPFFSGFAENDIMRPDLVADTTAITSETVWTVRGPDAPASFDLTRRPAVLDEMGIERQLVFASFGFLGLHLVKNQTRFDRQALSALTDDPVAEGRAVLRAHNGWCTDTAGRLDGDRVRPVAGIWSDDLAGMVADAEALLDGGIRCVMLPSGAPPAGMSPGDAGLDPFWQLMERTRTPVVLHIGSELQFLASNAWSAGVPAFQSKVGMIEFPGEPLACSTLVSYAPENFLCAMVLGGVFERFPALRVGVIECGAHWVGHLAEKLDLWAAQYARRLSDTLLMAPSAYLTRNVRVTPLCFEPVDRYIERYPELVDVYAFSTDYPHNEGGKDSKRLHYEKVAKLGDDVVEKYFVTNGSWLLPD